MREADGRQRAAEAPEQVVVAPAAAERLAERRVVDVEDRARVVAQAAGQAEVEDDALGDRVLEQVEDVAQARAARRPPAPGGRVEHVGPAAQLRHAHEQLGVARRRGRARGPRARGRRSPSSPSSLQQALAVLLVDAAAPPAAPGYSDGVAEADAIALEADGVQRVAQHGQRLGGAGGARARRRARCRPAGTRASGRGAGVTCAVGVGDVAEAQRRLGRLVARGHDAARSAPSCRRAGRARRRGRRPPGRPAARRRRRGAGRTRTRSPACRPRRSRGARRRRAGRR